jgi:5-methylthioribose kinase
MHRTRSREDSGDDQQSRVLVHGDFSPKNLLVHRTGLTLVDFETAHAGDPAFDLGFFLSHLVLKAFRAARRGALDFTLTDLFWEAYQAQVGVDAGRMWRAVWHTAACVLARLDGKSPVDYLHELDQHTVRRFARRALLAAPPDWSALLELAALELQRSGSAACWVRATTDR